MIPTDSLSVFLENNSDDFKNMVVSLCDSLNFPGSPEDVVQDLYVKFLTSQIIQSFRPVFRKKETKMTTYLYPIIKNYIISKIKSNECRFFRQNLPNYEPSHDVDEVDHALCHHPISVDYVDVILYNESTDSPDGLGSEFKAFKRLLRSNRKNKRIMKKRKAKKYDFLEELRDELTVLKGNRLDVTEEFEYREIANRIKKEVITCDKCGQMYKREKGKCPKCQHKQNLAGCSLIDIFILLYRGYTGRQIARIYGVSDMSVTNAKYKLAKALLSYGIIPVKRKKGKPDGRTKMSPLPRRRRNRRS